MAMASTQDSDVDVLIESLRVAVYQTSGTPVKYEERIKALSEVERCVRSGELRDLDEDGLFQMARFYESLGSLLPSWWSVNGSNAENESDTVASASSARTADYTKKGIYALPPGVLHAGNKSHSGPEVGAQRKRVSAQATAASVATSGISMQQKISAAGGRPVGLTSAPFARTPAIIGAPKLGASLPSEDVCLALKRAYYVVLGVMQLPEFDPHSACSHPSWRRSESESAPAETKTAAHEQGFGYTFATALVRRFRSAAVVSFETSETDSFDELVQLKPLLHKVYELMVPLRPCLLATMSDVLKEFFRHPTPFCRGVSELLEVAGAVFSGMKEPIPTPFASFLADVLVPAHAPHQMLNDSEALLRAYHEPLVFCLSRFMITSPSVVPGLLQAILRQWPRASTANTPKTVLIIHELDTLMEYCTDEHFAQVAPLLFPHILASMSSLNFRVAEQSLVMWQNDYFVSLTMRLPQLQELVFFPAISALFGEPSWNKTVNAMRATVLKLLRTRDEESFWKCTQLAFKGAADYKEQAETRLRLLEPPEQKVVVPEPVTANVPPQMRDISYMDFVFGHTLGRGSFAQVKWAKRITKGQMPSTWREYAIKIVDMKVVEAQNYAANIEREVKMMDTIRHPSVTRLLGAVTSDHRLYLVLEYAALGDLHNHISSLGSLSLETARFVMAEVLTALECVHSHGIVFGDLKPENILVHKNRHVKLSDFGSARYEEEIQEEERLEGTAEYMAPEVVSGQKATRAADMWAYGCVLFQVLAGRTPVWVDLQDSKEAEQEVLRKIVSFDLEQEQRGFPSDFPEDAKDLVLKLMRREPAARLGVTADGYAAIKSHPFFSSIDFTRLHDTEAPQLAQGRVAPQPNASWSRRKMSMLHAPMPSSYSLDSSTLPAIEQHPLEGQLWTEHKARAHELAAAGKRVGTLSSTAKLRQQAGDSIAGHSPSSRSGLPRAPARPVRSPAARTTPSVLEEEEEEEDETADDSTAAAKSPFTTSMQVLRGKTLVKRTSVHDTAFRPSGRAPVVVVRRDKTDDPST